MWNLSIAICQMQILKQSWQYCQSERKNILSILWHSIFQYIQQNNSYYFSFTLRDIQARDTTLLFWRIFRVNFRVLSTFISMKVTENINIFTHSYVTHKSINIMRIKIDIDSAFNATWVYWIRIIVKLLLCNWTF